jgi:type 2 lantibiotic biosynthesis protein LanM
MLTERIRLLHAAQAESLNVAANADLASRKIQQWQSQEPFTNDSHFAQRLTMDGITRDELLYLLGEPLDAVRDRLLTPPQWLVELAGAFACPASSNAVPVPEALRGKETVGFLNAIEPLIRQARKRVHEGIEALMQMRPACPFAPDPIEEVLYAHLPGQLLMMVSRTLALELHVARLQGFLKGDTPKERFHSFNERLRQRTTALAILQEYPVLARQLLVCIDHWVHFSLEFLHRLRVDCEAIQTTFCPEQDLGVLVALDAGAGDSHRSGRCVLLARFSSGFQVVYKPKSLAVDGHFQALLGWSNARGDLPPFRVLKMLDRGTYGWVEFVEGQGCASAEELRRFYERQGGYLALLYALEATDFHCENIIAAGEHPVLVDLEAFFHPRLGAMDVTQADQLASRTLYESVLRVGLLPERLWSNGESEGIDISGLGATAGQRTPYGIPQWDAAGTDEMRLIRKPVEIPGGHNRPTLHGAQVDVLDYAEAIVAGFTAAYRLLLKHRDELLSPNGLLARFAGDDVRVILRPTRTYAVLLQESFHPDVLRDALDRDRLFDRLWVGIEALPYLAKVIPAEREDLWNNDIPMFTTRPNSRDLWSSSGERMVDFFDESGLALVRRRVQHLSDDDLAQQLWFIRASLTTLAMRGEGARHLRCRLTEPQSLADPKRLLAAAQSLGDRLETVALRGDGDASWIGLTLTAKDHWSLMPLGLDLYNGLPGVALFLAYLGDVTGEARYTALAQAALAAVRQQVERDQSYITSIGGFDGWGGIIYTLLQLGALWHQPELLAQADELVGRLPELIEQDEVLDIIGGAAGCIGCLISLYRCAPSERTLTAAIRCGDRLIARAQPVKHGLGWTSRFLKTGPLTGFSHGAAGIAWALLELAALTSEERFKTTALDAITYERSLFSPEAGNWPDLREFDIPHSGVTNNAQEEQKFMTAWCHGAPGIGLARLRALPYLDDSDIRMEIDTALQTTLAQGFGSNHSLCHGDLGNLELLLQAAQTFDDPQWRAQMNHIAAMILESIQRDGWLCGVPLGVESPGLMTGLAGIGYGLLRLAEPRRVPSVLVLEPPTPYL